MKVKRADSVGSREQETAHDVEPGHVVGVATGDSIENHAPPPRVRGGVLEAAGDLAARRKLAEFLTEPAVVKKLVEQIAPSLKGRSGGYTRITKTRVRSGDAAELSLLELVK